jgi:hypothetical protein
VRRGSPDATGLLKRLRAFRGRLPADFNFDRDEAYARQFSSEDHSKRPRKNSMKRW